MLQSTSRIEKNNGIRFYEQDILIDDYIHTGNLLVNLDIEYITPGFGIALLSSEGLSLKDKEEVLLFRLGYKEASVIYKNKDIQKTLATYNVANLKTYAENLNIILSKVNELYSVSINGKEVLTFNSPYEINSYNLGYYSDTGNAIKNINIASAIPFGWIVNMNNTKNGYISFEKNGFSLQKCEGFAEIEQIEIKLNAGKYYLKYEQSKDCDIKPYVFLYNDDNIIDEEKQMLSLIDNSFILSFPTKVNLKLKGTQGSISKLQITTEKDNDYIKTSPETGNYVDIGGSYMNIRLESLKEVEWIGIINNVPGSFHKEPIDYALISDGIINYGLYDLNVSTGVKYGYRYVVSEKRLTVYKLDNDGKKSIQVYTKVFTDIEYLLTVFKNINAVITRLKLTTLEGNIIEDIAQDTAKKYVPCKIKSPIIVTNKHNLPLDLSSSIRVYKHNNTDKYIFTNIEREYFDPKHIIKLSNIPSKKNGTTIVYGIKRNGSYDMDNILRIPHKDMINSIDDFATAYDILFEKDLRSYDKDTGEIRLNDVSKYSLIVVDYLKRDSYAINYIHYLSSYEVDISIEQDDEANIIYDNIEKTQDKTNTLLINAKEYVQTNMIPSENCYITIGR